MYVLVCVFCLYVSDCICMYVQAIVLLLYVCMYIHIALGLRVEISARREAHLALNEADKMHSKPAAKCLSCFWDSNTPLHGHIPGSASSGCTGLRLDQANGQPGPCAVGHSHEHGRGLWAGTSSVSTWSESAGKTGPSRWFCNRCFAWHLLAVSMVWSASSPRAVRTRMVITNVYVHVCT
jgi:hypothetical protein